MFFAATRDGAAIISDAVEKSSSAVGTNENDFLILATPQEGIRTALMVRKRDAEDS
jgi:hypothetical protein